MLEVIKDLNESKIFNSSYSYEEIKNGLSYYEYKNNNIIFNLMAEKLEKAI